MIVNRNRIHCGLWVDLQYHLELLILHRADIGHGLKSILKFYYVTLSSLMEKFVYNHFTLLHNKCLESL